jgi:hypothetical protein
MSSTILYKELFEVKILHHYFLDIGEKSWDTMTPEERDKMQLTYNVHDFFDIIPTIECKKALTSQSCIFKCTPEGFLVGVKAEPDDLHPGKFMPFKSLRDDLAFRFVVRLRDSSFMNYSDLPLLGHEGKMFVFKNFKVEGSENPLTLTSAPPVYTSASDQYPVSDGLFAYTMKVKDTSPFATLKTLSGTKVAPRMEILQGEFQTLQVDLRNFTPGFYLLHVVGDRPGYQDEVTFYLTDQPDIPFGVFEIRVKSDQPAFSLTSSDHLVSPVYKLRFRNRRTYWRYNGNFPGAPLCG